MLRVLMVGVGMVPIVSSVSAQTAPLEQTVRDQADLLRRQQERIEALERAVRALSATTAAAVPAEKATASSVSGTNVALAQGSPISASGASGERNTRTRAERLRQLPAGSAALRPPTDPFTAPSPPGQSTIDADETFDWRKGLPQITSRDGRFAFRLRGRALMDFSTTSGSRYDARNITGTEARSVRLGVEGRAGDKLAYLVEFDLGDNRAALRSAYLAYTQKWGKNDWEFSLGNRLTDRSIDGGSSSDSLPLLERSVAALATTPAKGSFGIGAMLKVFGTSWHVAAQVAGNEPGTNGTADDTVTMTGRVHWNPWRSRDGIVHIGGWAYREEFSSSVASLPLSVRLGGRFNDLVTGQTSNFVRPDHSNAYGLEAGGTWRSFWMFGEYAERRLYDRAGYDENVEAASLSTGLYLTGEKAPYVARSGTWSKPRVLHPVVDGGAGAIEIAARYDRLRYTGPHGSDGWSATFGANWYPLDWARLSLDGILWRTDNRAGIFVGPDTGQTLYTRMQISF